MESKIEVKVTINAIVLFADESVTKIDWGHGYHVLKLESENFPCFDRIIDAQGKISDDYFPSRILEQVNGNNVISFYCLQKQDVFFVPSPQMQPGKIYSNLDLERTSYLDKYKDEEFTYLYKVISLLQIYKDGNIGFKDIFFNFNYSLLGLFKNSFSATINIKDANTIKRKFYALSEAEVSAWVQFRNDNLNSSFLIMKDIVDVFTFGLKQIDGATAFEKYTTALEMIFLAKNQQCKKEVLSKRIAALLGQNDIEIVTIYKSMKTYYRYRSESLHEGEASNITNLELDSLSDITRRSIRRVFLICNNEIAADNSITWCQVKANLIKALKTQVETLTCRGLF